MVSCSRNVCTGWVNNVYLITYGHLPDFLNVDHPKLKIINHTDYIPSDYLPTFSSHTIELNMHRIEGLSEHFVYFNDDMFLNQPMSLQRISSKRVFRVILQLLIQLYLHAMIQSRIL
ncbi:hypothetical protein [Erysipelothrix piscisicarius]|uniref:hypothetical protein n=1 Tax=Erysipelothrix piscisicarius TaxID=2485784 RepID=UPI002F927A0C